MFKASYDCHPNSLVPIHIVIVSWTSKQTQAYLQVFVEDASHGGEGAIIPLMFDEPGLGRSKLLRVNEDETPRLSEGLQHKCRQPTGRRNRGGGMRQIKMGEGEEKGEGD